MIPLRDNARPHRFPVVTIILMALNFYVFFRQFMMPGTQVEGFLLRYGLVPALLTERLQEMSWLGLLYAPLFTSFFLHGGLFHLLSNMLYLWVFGDNIEDRLGHFRFLIFYVLCGLLANGAHYLTDIYSPIPLIGASGAVAGVLGAYFISYPHAKVTSLVFFLFFISVREIPAFYFLLFWIVIQIMNGVSSFGAMGVAVAWWAHIGGFFAGILLMLLLRKRENQSLPPS